MFCGTGHCSAAQNNVLCRKKNRHPRRRQDWKKSVAGAGDNGMYDYREMSRARIKIKKGAHA